MKHKDKIVLDTETTGLLEHDAALLEQQPYIVEIYAARINRKGKVIAEVDEFVSCPIPIPPLITKIHGITDDMLIGAKSFAEVYLELIDLFIGTETMIAHNLPFDAGMLWVELSRLGREFQFPWSPKWYCTMEKSFHIRNKRLKLTDLHEIATGEPHLEGAHRAKQDVFALIRCYQWMISEGM